MKMKVLCKRVLLTLGVAALSLGAATSSARADFTIDAFDFIQDVFTKHHNTSAVAPGIPDVLGGDRKLVLDKTSTNGTLEVDINNNDPGKLDFSGNGTQTTGTAIAIYDGSTSFTGLGDRGVATNHLDMNVLSNGIGHQPNTGLDINATADHGGVSIIATFYDTSGHTSVATIVPNAVGDNSFTNYFALFTAFSGNADLTHVAAFTVEIIATQGGTNVSVDYIATSAISRSVPEPASFALVGLGLLGTGFSAYRRRKMAV